jgi:hypothetical protein
VNDSSHAVLLRAWLDDGNLDLMTYMGKLDLPAA